ncbi:MULTISPECIES: cold shock small protein YmcF [Erwiniaceae]|uniref:cold shock small protein YmcF n=1 Tax=[Pantoea] beijingensis TaxID=1324864 RepID=UPI000FE32436|nr:MULTISPECIES: cold-shock protein [Erwiniaceae]
MLTLKFKCPCCHGNQYRLSRFDSSAKNPHGAVCIFCKSGMIVHHQPAPERVRHL